MSSSAPPQGSCRRPVSKVRPGDRVAVLSPSAGLAAVYPHVYELGLRRLRDQLGLVPVEYPSTRAVHASPADRAADVTAAFADPDIAAVLATVGGDDQLTVIRHLDDEVLRANPKPFFGYSDNTNLLHHLYQLHAQGAVAFHGGSVLVHLGRPGAMHPLTLASLRAALFTDDWYELVPSPDYSDEPLDWSDLTAPGALESVTPPMTPATGWHWHIPTSPGPAVIEGPVWGGNLEIISWLAAADRLAPPSRFSGHVLLLETSQELPSDVEVYRMLRNLGERGLLAAFAAVLVGRAKAWDFGCRRTPSEKAAYAAAQRAAVLRAFTEYGSAVSPGGVVGGAAGTGAGAGGGAGFGVGVDVGAGPVIVFDLDVGHTDPQLIVPIGGLARIDVAARRIHVHY
ncbi:S66 family peptidase [Solwaraspora sp. WMMA2101]|uniref:S66 family peptidase n=1 Tax=Solwaraspora sp. WMMA2101 TaxID=3404124 RepID=UPI003B93B58B